LPRKLGIKAGTKVALLGAPDGFESLLGPLPDGCLVSRNGRGKADLVVWFVHSRAELERKIVSMSARVGREGLWIAWPKGKVGGVTQSVVRSSGLANGLVDYKIAAIDERWSGLKFTRRKVSKATRA
jgi:hypothetical protein